ncbi:MAG: hypothetical protein JJU36_15500 [Phycisphaeraceae bacterium]|nr:hypothetical protein [Phycisphaeraceae bacterium]
MSRTTVAIENDRFLINGRPTLAGLSWRDMPLEGLLPNSRMVQAIFDDANPQTRNRWDYPDGPWDAQRNSREFLAAMPTYRAHGLLAMTLNLQGGSPKGYSQEQPWCNNPFDPDGTFGDVAQPYLERLGRILDLADELGMVIILGIFYFGQDHRLEDDAAVRRAVDQTVDWLIQRGDRHVMIEVGNEVDNAKYTRDAIRRDACHELIEQVKERSRGKLDTPAGRLLVSTSLCGNKVPPDRYAQCCDFLLLHGNGVSDPDRIREMVDQTRALPSFGGQPVVFNEDDHFEFDQPDNNFIAATSRHASWGYFDYRMEGEGFSEGYQSVPVDWTIGSDRKRGFFGLLAGMSRVDPAKR